MKLLTALHNLIRGTSDSLAESLADPVRDGRLAINDASNQIGLLNTQLHSLLTSTEILKTKQTHANADIAKFEQIAVLAGSKNEVEDVKSALAQKTAAQNDLDAYTHQIEQNNSLEREIRTKANDLLHKMEAAKSNFNFLSTSVEFENVRGQIAKAAASPTDTTALDSLAKAADDAKASANAWEQLATENHSKDSLELKYSGSGAVTDDDVAKYLAKK